MFNVKQFSLWVRVRPISLPGCMQIGLCSNASRIFGSHDSDGSGAFFQSKFITFLKNLLFFLHFTLNRKSSIAGFAYGMPLNE